MTKKRIKPNTIIGQALEELTSYALTMHGFEHHFNWQYDKDFVKVDLAHPKDKSPNVFAEITQTDVRNSIQRKLLRYFELVSGIKITFGENSLCGTIIFGNPAHDLPAANLKASIIFFDFSIIPSSDPNISPTHKLSIDKIEQIVSNLAHEGINQLKILQEVKSNYPKELSDLGQYILNEIERHQSETATKSIWRQSSAPISENIDDLNSFYKSTILNCLFISETDFEVLEKAYKSGTVLIGHDVPESLVDHLVSLGLGKTVSFIGGIKLEIADSIQFVIDSSIARNLLSICYREMKTLPTLYFFQDIWDMDRRLGMADTFINSFIKGKEFFNRILVENLLENSTNDIYHSRAWIADIIQIHLETSQNMLNNRVLNDSRYNISVANPYNNIVIKSPSVVKPINAASLASIISDLAYTKSIIDLTRMEIARKVLDQRMEAAMYLQLFNPLHLFIFDELHQQGWIGGKKSFPSIISDLLDNGRTGKFKMIEAVKNEKVVVIAPVATKDGNDDHKSKEWATRGKAISLKYEEGTLGTRTVGTMIFLCDGRWSARSRRRLERAGWITCSLESFPAVLSSV